MKSSKRILINTIFLYLRIIISLFISLFSTRYILSSLGAKDYGIFNVVSGSIVMLTFLNIAMSQATQRYMSYTQGKENIFEQKRIFSTSVILHSLLSFIIVLIMEIGGYFLFKNILKIDFDRIGAAKIIFQFAVINTFISVISVPYVAVINAHENMFIDSIIGIFESFAKLIISIILCYISYDKLIFYSLLITIVSIFLLFYKRFYCLKKYEEVRTNIFKYFNFKIFKDMLSFASWGLLGTIMSLINNYGKNLLINVFFGTIVNAAQAITEQIVGQLGAFSNVLTKALNPFIDKSEGAGNRDLMITASYTGNKFAYFLLIFFALPVFIELPYILNLWLKNVPEYTITFCRIYLISYILGQLTITFPLAISATGNIKNFQIVQTFTASIPLFVSYLFFHKGFSPISLYIIFLIYEPIRAAIIIYFTKKRCNISITSYLKDVIFPCFLITLILFCISYSPKLFLKVGLIRLILICTLNFLFYIVLVLKFGLSNIERLMVLNIIPKKFTKYKIFKLLFNDRS